MNVSSVETKSAPDIIGRHSEFKRKHMMVGFADFQRDTALQNHCSSQCIYPLGGGGGLKREGKGIQREREREREREICLEWGQAEGPCEDSRYYTFL
jgi:hypothetical protein